MGNIDSPIQIRDSGYRKPEIKEGMDAHVEIFEDTVEMSPVSVSLGSIYAINEKMKKQEIFNSLVEDYKGIRQPKILEKDTSKGKYIVERIKTPSLDPLDKKDFSKKPFLPKVTALCNYVQVMEILQRKGYSFFDHKTDSIFIYDDGVIAIPDANIVDTSLWNTSPSLKYDMAKGFKNVVYAFFNYGYATADDEEYASLVPQTIKKLLQMCEDGQIKEMEELRGKLLSYYIGKDVIPSLSEDHDTFIKRIEDTAISYQLNEELKQYLNVVKSNKRNTDTQIKRDNIYNFIIERDFIKRGKFK